MALVCSSVYLSPDIEGMVVDLDKNNYNHSETVEDLEKLSTKKKFVCNTELNNAQHKLRGQKRGIRSLCDRSKQLEKDCGVENESLDTLRAKELGAHGLEKIYYIERKNVCLKTSFANEDAEKSALYQNIDYLKEETKSLKLKMNSKDIEIRQLRFRNKLLNDTMKSKLGKNIELCNVIYENTFLQEQMAFFQEDTLIKDKELSKLSLELKKANEWNVYMTTEDCTLNVKLAEHEQDIKKLQETINHEIFLKNEFQRALDQSLRKEAELGVTLLQLKDENKKNENKIQLMKIRLNRCSGIIHDKEAQIKKVTDSWQREIEKLEARLEQSYQDILKGKAQATIAQERMSKLMECLQDEMNKKETALMSIQTQVKQYIKTNEDKEENLNGIISRQNSVIKHLQTELERRPLNHTIRTRLRHSVEELEQSKCAIQEPYDYSKSIVTLKKETETKIIGMLNDAKLQSVYLQEQLKQSCDEMALLRGKCSEHRYSNQQDDIQISEMKHETERNTKLLQDSLKLQGANEVKLDLVISQRDRQIQKFSEDIRKDNLENKGKECKITELNCPFKEVTEHSLQIESDSRNRNSFLQLQPETTETDLKQHTLEIRYEKELPRTNKLRVVKMKDEMESPKLELKGRGRCNKKLKDEIHPIEKEETQVNTIVNKPINEIKHLPGKMAENNIKSTHDDQSKNYNEQLQQEINKLKEDGLHLRKTNQDTELKGQLDEMSNISYQTENELRYLNNSKGNQVKKADIVLKHKLEVSYENELTQTNPKRFVQSSEGVESLKLEMKGKDTTLQGHKGFQDSSQCKEEAVLKLNINIESQHLVEEIEKRDIKLASFDQVNKPLSQVQQFLNNSHENEDINRLQAKHEIQNNDKVNLDQVENRNKQSQQAMKESHNKEAELGRTFNVLQNRKHEHEGQISELNNHVNKSKRKENQLENMNNSLRTQLKTTESKLKELQQEMPHEKELSSTNEKRIVGIIIDKNIESLKQEMKLIEARMIEYDIQYKDDLKIKKEAESKLIEIINKQNREIQDLQIQIEIRDTEINDFVQEKKHSEEVQQAFNDLYEKEAELRKSNKVLHYKNKEKEDEVSEVKKQLSELMKRTSQKENELKHILSSIEQQLKNTEAKMRKQQLDISHEKELMIAKDKDMFQLGEEIKSLKLEVKQKESMIQNCSEQYKDAVQLKQEAESKLNDIINNLKTEVRHLQRDIERKDIERARIDQENDRYKQDIANAKQHSNAVQIKMSNIGTRINVLMKKMKTKKEELHKGKENLGDIIDSQNEHIQHLEREVQRQERKTESVEKERNNELEQMENSIDELENQMKHMLSKLHDTDAELDETKSRLSRVMEDNLTDSSLNITDLSDRNRPTKIAEKCAELYENELTYAFDVLNKIFQTEQAAMEALLLILQNTMHFCKTMARRQIEIIEREMYFADETEIIEFSSSYIQKIIKDRRKATAADAVRNLKKIYVAELKKSKDKIMRAALDVEPYTLECIEICWFMLIQDPPVVFAPLPIKDSSFDSDVYKPYTKGGTHVEFAVWPALLLYDKGPILAKGVAQGYENY